MLFVFFFFFFFNVFFYCSTKYTAYMNQMIYIHTISLQRIKNIIMVSYNYVYTSIITISVTCINGMLIKDGHVCSDHPAGCSMNTFQFHIFHVCSCFIKLKHN